MATARQGKQERSSGWVRTLSNTQPIHSLRFARSRDDVLIGGVAAGLGARWGVDPVLVRLAFGLLSWAGEVGVIAYLAAWSLSLEPGDRRAPTSRPPSVPQGIAFGSFVLGMVVLLRAAGLWLGDAIGVPLVIGAIGAAVVYVGTGADRKFRGLGRTPANATARPPLVHLILGAVFVVGGITWFLTTNRSFSFDGMFTVLLAIGITTFGLAIVFGPWVFRMTNQLGEERRDRMRTEDRAELAAHLHDSVLQTLALIQRNAGSPRKMASLARRQERELRAWLYGQLDITGNLDAAIHAMADEIEEAHEVTVETVLVGDCALNDRTQAIVQACREAVINAARHSGSEEISVYIECEPTSITAFVRDRGKGFDPLSMNNGRRGIADSIKGRMERHGGHASITSSPGEGCEVHLTMPTGDPR